MKIVYYVLLVLLTALFCFAGIVKLQDHPVHWAVFEKAGYSRSFFHGIAVMELLAAAGVWWPAGRTYALAGMFVIMIGAVVTHLKSHDAAWHYIVPVLVMACCWWLYSRQLS
ncbi:DoxX family protein [Chitinophaga sp. HK235]|uniref:DoxX family protein n=1 Tax=Chitinophaga sp. HK235 TaxID=2952571 RepID=UPI001BA76E0B|nr:DoxX family protein [Chitinophaga sp. HK235]